MKINRKVLSIPPHISTSWKNVASLHIQNEGGEKILVVTLENESIIEVPNLTDASLKEVFEAHTKFLEQGEESSVENKQNQNVTQKTPLQNPFAIAGDSNVTFGMPFKMDGLGNIGDFMHHNQEQANSPDLPNDMIEKITTVGKAIGLDKQLESMPKAEPHCNCPFCQVSRALHGDSKEEAPAESFNPDEEVSDDELSFKEWDIKQMGQDLYHVTNPLDTSESYQVFLGENLGCTCGHKNCEHLKAVLNS
ncbi:MAG: hypothetical protein S4CHLAM37_16690 [Chlamydiia bacterium]|nr:hypothetical protein [Chlamydiia bacterium]